jgi:hypothetical protein
MNLTEVEWGDMDWIHLAQNLEQRRDLVNVVINLWVPKTFGNS